MKIIKIILIQYKSMKQVFEKSIFGESPKSLVLQF
jgi:hypothetical protein